MTFEEFLDVCTKCGYIINQDYVGPGKYAIYKNNHRETYTDIIASYNTYNNHLTCYINECGEDDNSIIFKKDERPNEFLNRLAKFKQSEVEEKKKQRRAQIDEL